MFIFVLGCSSENRETESHNVPTEIVQEIGEFTQEYYDEGGIKTKGHKVDGKRNGLWTSYFPNGTIWSESTYKLGILDGKTKVYYPTGILRYKGQFRDGKRIGKWIEYLEDGKVDLVKEYPN